LYYITLLLVIGVLVQSGSQTLQTCADLIHHISSCHSDSSVHQLAVQLVTPHRLSTSVPQLPGPEITAVNISCALPSDLYYYPFCLCSIP